MKKITKKSVVKRELQACLAKVGEDDISALVSEFKSRLLDHKVKFPLLEYCGAEIHAHVPEKDHILFCDMIESLKTEGGNVILGIMLQKRLAAHFNESVDKGVAYISKAEEWYVPDIIGERLWGWALQYYPEPTLKVFRKLIAHENRWVVRSLGAGVHNAIKNEVDQSLVRSLFSLLLSKSDSTDHQIKRGMGWAAKTTARLHPDVIREFEAEIYADGTGCWFRYKVEMGLKRKSHAEGN